MPWGGNAFSHVFMLLLICFFCMCVCFAISPSIWVSLGVRRNVCSPAFTHFLYLLCSASYSNFLISSIILTPASSPPASLRSLAFTWPRFCVFTLFSQPLHTLLYWNFSACQHWLRERLCSHYFILCLINTGIDLSYLVLFRTGKKEMRLKQPSLSCCVLHLIRLCRFHCGGL